MAVGQRAIEQPLRGFRGAFDELIRFFEKTAAITEIEIRKLSHDPIELLTRAVQPMLWLLVFGQVFTQIRAIPTGNLSYLDFMTPGILAQSVLFVAIFYGIAVIWERDLGIVHKFLVSPTPRVALVLGKALSASVRGLSQADHHLHSRAGDGRGHQLESHCDAGGVLLAVILGAAFFSTFSLILASFLKTRERSMGIGQVLSMPLFFASNAIYPTAIMPPWLQAVAHVNPLSYEVDALRGLMLVNGASVFGIGTDFVVLILATAVAVVLGARVYPRVVI